MRDASPEVPVVAVSWVCSVVACVVRNAEQARLTRTTRTFICCHRFFKVDADF